MSQMTNGPIPENPAQPDKLIQNLRAMAQHLGKDAGDAMAKTAAALAHAAADLAEQVRKQAAPVVQKAGKELREHPVSTAAIVAASIGLISYALTHDGTHKA